MAIHPRKERAYLAANPHGHPCWQCGAPASTRDHVPPLRLHEHREGSGCCIIMPACGTCNARDGQAITAQLNQERAELRRLARRRRHGLLAVDDVDAWMHA